MTIYSLLILSLLLFQGKTIQARNSALCFLSERPIPGTIPFIEQLAKNATPYDIDIFIMIDDNNFNVLNANISSNIRLLQIPNQECIKYGYKNTISLHPQWREITSWDKALLYFSEFQKNYSFVWLIEQDVFIPSIQAFYSLHQLYSNTSDLVVPHHTINLLGDTSIWHWNKTIGKFIQPWSSSMVNIIGLSRRLLTAINDYVRWRGEIPFHEFFFNTLAMQLNMNIVTPTELNTILYEANHNLFDVYRHPNNLMHPLKDIARQNKWHEILANETLKYNHTMDFTDIETLCQINQPKINIEDRLSNLLSEFKKRKSQFSLIMRRALRQRFTYLAEQCQKRNDTKQIIFLAMSLADHAYKLPEPLVPPLVKNKSIYHLKLEQALNENKETILRLPIGFAIINDLRKQAINLTEQLTNEIKREVEEEKRLLNPTTTTSSTRRLSSSTTRISTTTTTTTSNRMTIATTTDEKMNKLTKQSDPHLQDSFEINNELVFLMMYILCTLCVLLFWKKLRNHQHLVIISIFLILIFCWYLVVSHINETF